MLVLVIIPQETVEKASMGHVDRNTFTPQQLSVEKLIKEQNFNWKVTSNLSDVSSCLVLVAGWGVSSGVVVLRCVVLRCVVLRCVALRCVGTRRVG